MFWSEPSQASEHRAPLGGRVRDALALARALLTLEDEYDVDWDFGPEDAASPPGPSGLHTGQRAATAQRRAADRPRKRRAGAPGPARQVCVSPLPARTQRCRQFTRTR